VNNDVTQYINKARPWQIDVCLKLRTMIDQTVPGVEERLQYGKPHYLKDGHYVAVIAVAKAKVSFMVFNATDIPEVKGFLRGMGNGERKTVDIKEGQDIDYPRSRQHPGKDHRCQVAPGRPGRAAWNDQASVPNDREVGFTNPAAACVHATPRLIAVSVQDPGELERAVADIEHAAIQASSPSPFQILSPDKSRPLSAGGGP
jgi:hypothetical protein